MSDVTVKVGAQTSGLRSGLAQARAEVTSFAHHTSNVFAGAGARFAEFLSLAGLIEGGRRILEFAGKIKEQAKTIDFSTEAFQRQRAAFVASGAEQDDFVRGTAALIDAVQQAKDGNVEMVKALADIGLSWQDILNLPTDQYWAKVAEALKDTNDDAAAFGNLSEAISRKMALKLFPALIDGGKHFHEMGERATVAGKDAIDAAAEIEKSWRLMLINLEAGVLNFAKTAKNKFHEVRSVVTQIGTELGESIVDLLPKVSTPALTPDELETAHRTSPKFLGVAKDLVGKKQSSGLKTSQDIREDTQREMGQSYLRAKKKIGAEEASDATFKQWEAEDKIAKAAEKAAKENPIITAEKKRQAELDEAALKTARTLMTSRQVMLSLEKERGEALERIAKLEPDAKTEKEKDAVNALKKKVQSLDGEILATGRKLALQTPGERRAERRAHALEKRKLDAEAARETQRARDGGERENGVKHRNVFKRPDPHSRIAKDAAGKGHDGKPESKMEGHLQAIRKDIATLAAKVEAA